MPTGYTPSCIGGFDKNIGSQANAQSIVAAMVNVDVRRLNETIRSNIMANRMNLMLSFALVFACTWAFGDDSQVSTARPITLERAVLDFNEDSDVDRERLGLPRLTENEILSAIRGTTGMDAEDYKLFTEIADSKKLPGNAKLLLFRRRFANGYKSSVWNIVLSIKKNDNEHARVEVRTQYLSTEKDLPTFSAIQSSK